MLTPDERKKINGLFRCVQRLERNLSDLDSKVGDIDSRVSDLEEKIEGIDSRLIGFEMKGAFPVAKGRTTKKQKPTLEG
jgi:peptidoglycan hydrolase CwlO-like protein